jgi:hypothetical protein
MTTASAPVERIRCAAAPSNLLHRGSPLLTNLALACFGLLILVFCQAGVNEYHHYTFGMSEDIFAQLALYLGALSLIERCPTDKGTLPVIFTIALLARLICVFHPAFLSTDVYRYVWDGKVQAAGINPFRYIPADPHLAFLRDHAIYPLINRKDYAHTIYPPGAQALFFVITRLSATEAFMKLAMVAFEAATCAVLMRTLTILGQARERVLIYAWCPLCLWEIASSGHVDAAALTFLALATYARLTHKVGQTGTWLGAAALVKLYPAALLAALWPNVSGRPDRGTGRQTGRRDALGTTFATLAVILAGYACYASVGRGVFGFLSSYAEEEGISSGTRYFPLAFFNHVLHASVPPAAYVAACACVLLALCVWTLRRAHQPSAAISSALVLATALNLCYSPHYPWYFLWLLPFLTLYPWRPAFYLVIAASYLFATRLGEPAASYTLNELLYGGFFVLLGIDPLLAWLERAPMTQFSFHDPRQPATFIQPAALDNARES